MKKFSFNFEKFSTGMLAGFVVCAFLIAAFSVIAMSQVVISLVPMSAKAGFLPVGFLVVLATAVVLGIAAGLDGPSKELPLNTRGNFVAAESIDGSKGFLNVNNVITVNRIYRDGHLQEGEYHLRVDGGVTTRVHIDKNPWLKELIDASGR